MKLTRAITLLAVAGTATARSIFTSRTTLDWGLTLPDPSLSSSDQASTSFDVSDPSVVLWQFASGDNCTTLGTGTVLSGSDSCYSIANDNITSVYYDEHDCTAWIDVGPCVPQGPDSNVLTSAGTCYSMDQFGSRDLVLYARCNQTTVQKVEARSITSSFTTIHGVSTPTDPPTPTTVPPEPSASSDPDPHVVILQFEADVCDGERTRTVLGGPQAESCYPIDHSINKIYIDEVAGCELAIVSAAEGCSDYGYWYKQGECVDLATPRYFFQADVMLYRRCTFDRAGGENETAINTVASLSDGSLEEIGHLSAPSKRSADYSITAAEDISPTVISAPVTTISAASMTDSAPARVTDTVAADQRYLRFWVYTGDVCYGPATLYTETGGYYGDNRKTGCISIPDDVTRFKLLEAKGCVATLVNAACSVPMNFDNWAQVDYCENIEITGRTDTRVLYICDVWYE